MARHGRAFPIKPHYGRPPVVGAPALVSGLVKYWSGSAWVAKPVKLFNGSGYVIKPMKFWNGSAWVATSAFDSDAQAFFTAAGITDATQKSAVNQLVLDLKSYSIWTKMSAIYPFVGGTASTHKYNLKDARDLDAAFRIVWSGTVTHDSNGITGNGTTGYGDTKIVCDTSTTLNDVHFSAYCRTVGGSADNMCEIGANVGAGLVMQLLLKNQGATGPTVSQMYRDDVTAAWVQKTDASAQGFWMFSRRASNDFSGYKNGTSFQNQTATNTGGRPNRSLFILALNYSGGTTFYSNRNLALASVGTSLTDTEVTNFYTAVQAFQTSLSRNV